MIDAESHPGEMNPAAAADFCGVRVRRFDYDRYLAALFAPDSHRSALMALYAFNIEIAKIRESVSEPTLGRIRLQWWLETIEGLYGGRPRHHEVALALGDAVSRYGLDRSRFERLIEGRAFDLEDAPPESLAALEAYAGATSGALTQLALQVLGADTTEGSDSSDGNAAMQAGHHGGIAWALCGLVRAVPFHAGQRRSFLPADLMAAVGVTPGKLFEARTGTALASVVREVAGRAEFNLGQARQLRGAIPRHAVAAMLPLALADGDLRRLAKADYDVFALPSRDNRLMRQARIAMAALRKKY